MLIVITCFHHKKIAPKAFFDILYNYAHNNPLRLTEREKPVMTER